MELRVVLSLEGYGHFLHYDMRSREFSNPGISMTGILSPSEVGREKGRLQAAARDLIKK
jgi:hypothetical protein